MATILVVDDENSILAMLRYKLRIAGHEAIEVKTLEAAQEKVKQLGVPDLALVDLYLSATYDEGIEVCRWAKKLNIPVIATSAFLERDLRQKAEAVSDALLRKPEDLELIIPTIERLTAKGAE